MIQISKEKRSESESAPARYLHNGFSVRRLIVSLSGRRAGRRVIAGEKVHLSAIKSATRTSAFVRIGASPTKIHLDVRSLYFSLFLQLLPRYFLSIFISTYSSVHIYLLIRTPPLPISTTPPFPPLPPLRLPPRSSSSQYFQIFTPIEGFRTRMQ